MEKCDVCGNDYDKAFQVQMGGESHTFDSFECAIHALAPRPAVRRQGERTWPREGRPDLLLRSLRQSGGGVGAARPRLSAGTTSQISEKRSKRYNFEIS